MISLLERLVTHNVSNLSESRTIHGKVASRGVLRIVESEIFEASFCPDQLPGVVNLKEVRRICAHVGGED